MVSEKKAELEEAAASADELMKSLTESHDSLVAELSTKYETAEAEKAELSKQLEASKAQYTELSLAYEGLLEQKNEFQNALETLQDDINVRLALAEEAEKEVAESEVLPIEPEEYTDLEDANAQVREYYEQLEKLEDAMISLEIENQILRERIEEYTK